MATALHCALRRACPRACAVLRAPTGLARSLSADTQCYIITRSQGVANELWACSVIKKDIPAAARAAWAGGEGDTGENQNPACKCNTDRPASL